LLNVDGYFKRRITGSALFIGFSLAISKQAKAEVNEYQAKPGNDDAEDKQLNANIGIPFKDLADAAVNSDGQQQVTRPLGQLHAALPLSLS
jgi:hypothetical protein